MDEQEELLSAVHHLAWPGTGDLACDEAGHSAGHVCLAPSDENNLSVLQEALSGRYGRPRTLAMGGFADPTVNDRTGLPLLAPFGDRIVEMRAWAHAGRWIGCGTARYDDGVRIVALVAEREDPAADLAEVTSWVDGVVAVTGWDTTRVRTVDWAAVETRIGTALPGDYKRLVEVFGHGAFDGYLQFHVPNADFKSDDIVLHTEWLGEWATTHRSGLWEPYEVYPVPGGLLEWAGSEQADQFYWLTEDPDPDRWPILVKEDIPDSWQRFDETTAEFVYRMLTDRQHPFSTARYFDTHWFESYESEGQAVTEI
ncbi:SMI1/KNR4 family protein [Streptomyces sp. NBC_01142]|uniref:hypothetical protein n=1 Tax=Streptomyces sp. NBC_01142 TaxID=2975865 RepID=UPI00225ACE26|nr:hypothetical protein [Streptomyces sp. NBC_01142]MCX4823585.1 SMI1/KNR4 family protein [Streptomyces sp. NBC_01142]